MLKTNILLKQNDLLLQFKKFFYIIKSITISYILV